MKKRILIVLMIASFFVFQGNFVTSKAEGDVASQFYVTKISDELFEKMQGKSYKKNCTVPREELRYIHVLHKNYKGKTLEGEMVVNRHIAKKVMGIFKKLYQENYPIERMRLVDEYDADDEMSMRDNNSSSFNFRLIANSKKVSKHGYGLAVDINTRYNPYVKKQFVQPATSKKYVNRSKKFKYKITKGDLAYKLFKKAGFEWGGEWKTCKDYQHFEIPTKKCNKWYPQK